MKWEEFVRNVSRMPVIQRDLLLAGTKDPASTEVQISRWVAVGKLIQLRRGIYVLSDTYRKVEIFEPYLASVLRKPSYVSREKALEYHGLIPEGVPMYTMVTTARPGRYETPFGVFDYRHAQESLFWGYRSVTVRNQTAFVALPEKALLDLFYFKKGAITGAYIKELRLQNTEIIELKRLDAFAKKFKKTKIIKAAKLLAKQVERIRSGEQTL